MYIHEFINHTSILAFSYNKVFFDEGNQAYDFEFLEVNEAFKEMLCLRGIDIVGKKISEVLKEIDEERSDLIRMLGEIAINNKKIEFEKYSRSLKKWFRVIALSFDELHFAIFLIDISKEKEQIQEISNQNEKLLSLINNMDDMVFILDENLNLKEYYESTMNPYADLKKAIGANYKDIDFPEPAYTDIKNGLLNSINQKQTMRLHTFVERYGKKEWYEVRISPIFDRTEEEDKIVGLTCTARSTTKEMQQFHELEENHRNFNNFFEIIDDIIIVSNLEGKILHINKAFIEKLGYKREDIVNMQIKDLHPKKYNDEAEQLFDRFNRGFKNVFIRVPIKIKDGDCILFETRAWPGTWGGEDCVFSLAKDLTDEQEYLHKLDKAFGLNPAIVTMNSIPDGSFFEVNDAFIEKLGYREEEVKGKIFDDLDILERKETKDEIVKLMREKGKISELGIRLKTKSGDILDGIFSADYIDSQGERYLLTATVDITENKQRERELYYKTNLQEIFTSIATNYINIPISKMDAAIDQSIEKVGRFIDADRAYVFEYDWESEIINNTHEWCDEDITPQIHKLKNIPIDMVPEWVETHKKGETLYIEDINLIPQDNNVRKILEPQEVKSLIAIPIIENGSCMGFVGFDSVRKYRKYSKKEEGFDLVLSDYNISDSDTVDLPVVLNAMQSTKDIPLIQLTALEIEEKQGEAKTNRLLYNMRKPYKRNELLSIIEKAFTDDEINNKSNAILEHKPRILLVEDDKICRTIFSKMLEIIGIEHDEALNGQEALSLYLSNDYDLIFMDCQMPVMDGYEATKSIRKEEKGKGHIPIIATTAYAMQGDEKKCFASGMDDYISKPVDFEKIEEIITKYLTKQRP